MTYYTGSLCAVPTANKQQYLDHLALAWPLMQRFGATRMVETWGTDVPKGKVTDLYQAVKAGPGETVVFSWIEWPGKTIADAAWQSMQTDPAMAALPPPPFDGKRMIFGGFEPVLMQGSDAGAGYYQGFVLAVPKDNQKAYGALALEVWRDAFQPKGCLAIMEGWGTDVPHGEVTDFYRAAKALPGEVPVFSWTAWPDKATCDAAAAAMEAEMAGKEMPAMPFDGMRMMWGGFEPIFDSHKA